MNHETLLHALPVLFFFGLTVALFFWQKKKEKEAARKSLAPLSSGQKSKLLLFRSRGRRSFIFRYGLLCFGLYLFICLSLFGWLVMDANPFWIIPITFFTSVIGGWWVGSAAWKKMEMQAFPRLEAPVDSPQPPRL